MLRRAAPSCCAVAPLGCPNRSWSGGVTQQQPPYKPNGVTPQHDGAARWLLRRWECVPSLIPSDTGLSLRLLTQAELDPRSTVNQAPQKPRK